VGNWVGKECPEPGPAMSAIGKRRHSADTTAVENDPERHEQLRIAAAQNSGGGQF